MAEAHDSGHAAAGGRRCSPRRHRRLPVQCTPPHPTGDTNLHSPKRSGNHIASSRYVCSKALAWHIFKVLLGIIVEQGGRHCSLHGCMHIVRTFSTHPAGSPVSNGTASRMTLHAFMPHCQAKFGDGPFICLRDPTCLRSRNGLLRYPYCLNEQAESHSKCLTIAIAEIVSH